MVNSKSIRDRVTGLRRVRAGDLVPHPQNWRRHSGEQRAALRGLVSEVGFAGAVLTRELDDGRLQIIDGHARSKLDEDAELPCLVTDLSEEEAKKVLLTFDPLGAMAEADCRLLDELLREVETGSEAVEKMLSALAKKEGLYVAEGQSGSESSQKPGEIESRYAILIECDSDASQRKTIEALEAEGYKCRALTV